MEHVIHLHIVIPMRCEWMESGFPTVDLKMTHASTNVQVSILSSEREPLHLKLRNIPVESSMYRLLEKFGQLEDDPQLSIEERSKSWYLDFGQNYAFELVKEALSTLLQTSIEDTFRLLQDIIETVRKPSDSSETKPSTETL